MLTDRATVLTDRATMLTNRATVLTDRATVLTDRATVLTDRATMLTDRATVLTDRATVATKQPVSLRDNLSTCPRLAEVPTLSVMSPESSPSYSARLGSLFANRRASCPMAIATDSASTSVIRNLVQDVYGQSVASQAFRRVGRDTATRATGALTWRRSVYDSLNRVRKTWHTGLANDMTIVS